MPPGNIRKPEVFLNFQEVLKESLAWTGLMSYIEIHFATVIRDMIYFLVKI